MTTGSGDGVAQVSLSKRAGVATIYFSNPPTGTIANKGAAQLCDVLASVLLDPAIRAVILTGRQQGVFIRHADVGQIARAADALEARRIEPSSFATSPFVRLGTLLDNADKPVIAAINGACMGGGLELALACTMRIAAPSVSAIGLPEIKIGIFPGAGGLRRLGCVIGRHRARLFALQGGVVDAASALAMNIVDELAEDPLERATEVAYQLAGRSPAAMRAILQLTRNDSGLAEVGEAMGVLLRDDAAVRSRLHAFEDGREELDVLE